MPVKSRKIEQAEATRGALLRVARKLFADRGYADTATEEVVRKARVTRGALYHHFRDKKDLFKAVLQEEQQKLAGRIAAVAGVQPDTWRQLTAGCQAFLDACTDPAVQQIVLLDAPAVLGWEGWREMDESYYLAGVRGGLEAAMAAGLIRRQPVDSLARVLLGALTEAAMLIAHADDETAARAEVSQTIQSIFDGLRMTAEAK